MSEALAAAAVVSEWRAGARVRSEQLSTSQLEQLRAYVMGALADARDGATIPGERTEVGAHWDLPVTQWRAELADQHRLAVRRRWAQELETQGLRPLDWPRIEVSGWAWNRDLAAGGPGQRQVNVARADMVRLSIRGPAVPVHHSGEDRTA